MTFLKENFFFSIIIPSYNVEKYIERTIISLKNQNFDDYEIIIIDDFSTDTTLSVLNRLQLKYCFKLITLSSNKGVSNARNIGIENSKGEYLLFLDADDLLAEFSLKKLYNEITLNPDIDLLSFGYSLKKDNATKLMNNFKYNNSLFNSYDFLKLYFKREILQCMCSFIVKADIVLSNNIMFNTNTFYAEDQEFQIKCAYFSDKILYKSDILFHYIINDNSSVKKKISDKTITVIDVFNRLNNLFLGKKIYPYFQVFALNNYYSLFRKIVKENALYMINYKIVEFTQKKVRIIKGNKLSYKIYIIRSLDNLSKNLLIKIFKYF